MLLNYVHLRDRLAILLSGNCFLSKEYVKSQQLIALCGGTLVKNILIVTVWKPSTRSKKNFRK